MVRKKAELEERFRNLFDEYGTKNFKLIIDSNLEDITSSETNLFIRNKEIYEWLRKYFLALTDLKKKPGRKSPLTIIQGKEVRDSIYKKIFFDIRPFLISEKYRWQVCLRTAKDRKKAIDYFIPIEEEHDISDKRKFRSDKRKFRAIIDLEYKPLKLDFSYDEKNIEKIKHACEISDKAMEHAYNIIKIGMSEKELKKEINHFIRKENCQLAFSSIVLFGENTENDDPFSKRSNLASDKKIKDGEFVLLDIGARYKELNSDLTRCFFVNKEKDKLTSCLYDLVLETQNKILNYIRAGRSIKEVAEYAKKSIPYLGFFGHGVGFEVHEEPFISWSETESLAKKLQEDMIIAIEPGIYIEEQRIGVRIEDTIRITKNGYEALTKVPKIKILKTK